MEAVAVVAAAVFWLAVAAVAVVPDKDRVSVCARRMLERLLLWLQHVIEFVVMMLAVRNPRVRHR